MIKKRSFFQRLIRCPKLWIKTWKLSGDASFKDKFSFCLGTILIVLK